MALRQLLERRRCAIADLGEGRGRGHDLAVAHDRLQETRPVLRLPLVLEPDEIPPEPAEPVDQLAAGPGALRARKLDPGRVAAPLVPDKLVDRAERAPDGATLPRAQAHRQVAADTEAVNRRPALQQVRDPELVQIAAHQHPHPAQPGLVQHAADVSAVGQEVAAVEPDRNQFVAQPRLDVARHRHRRADRRVDIVGVEQKRVARQALGHGAKSLRLAGEGLDQGVGNRAGSGNAEHPGTGRERGAGAAPDVGRAGGKVRVVGAAEPEVGDDSPARGVDEPRRLGRDQRRDPDRPQQP